MSQENYDLSRLAYELSRETGEDGKRVSQKLHLATLIANQGLERHQQLVDHVSERNVQYRK